MIAARSLAVCAARDDTGAQSDGDQLFVVQRAIELRLRRQLSHALIAFGRQRSGYSLYAGHGRIRGGRPARNHARGTRPAVFSANGRTVKATANLAIRSVRMLGSGWLRMQVRRITQDEYDKKARELKRRQTEIALRIEQHQKAVDFRRL